MKREVYDIKHIHGLAKSSTTKTHKRCGAKQTRLIVSCSCRGNPRGALRLRRKKEYKCIIFKNPPLLNLQRRVLSEDE
uniref:Uncharacterized protein n=1 Tax=Trichogramma kaykai TaxID=54128 RepID=A0ABD2WP64_9HYME